MQGGQRSWAKIISAVKTEWGLLALVVLVLGAFFGEVALSSQSHLQLVVILFGSIIAIVILVIGLERFSQARRAHRELMSENFARGLGEEIYAVFGGAIQNLVVKKERIEPYELLRGAVVNSKHVQTDAEKRFATALIDIVIYRAEQAEKKLTSGLNSER